MTTAETEPLERDWTPGRLHQSTQVELYATAAEVNRLLGSYDVADIDSRIAPLLAAAAAEAALAADIRWQFSTDDPPIALLRLLAKVGISCPRAGGPHTGRLHAALVG